MQPSDKIYNRLPTDKNKLQQQQLINCTASSPNLSANLLLTQHLASSVFSSQPQRNSSLLNFRKNFSLMLVN